MSVFDQLRYQKYLPMLGDYVAVKRRIGENIVEEWYGRIIEIGERSLRIEPGTSSSIGPRRDTPILLTDVIDVQVVWSRKEMRP